MQPLERYGVIALLFLAVATVAVFLWNDESAAEAAGGGGFLATAPPERSTTPPALANEIAAGEQKPRGLKRQPRPAKKQPTPEELAELDRQERMRRMADFSARARAEKSKASGPEANGRAGSASPSRPGQAGPASRASRAALASNTAAAAEDVEWSSERRRSNKGAASKRAPSRSKTDVRVPDESQEQVAQNQKSAGAKAKRSQAAKSVAAKSDRKDELAPGEYIVQPGDTLTGISQKLLGRASRWKEIVAVNANLNPKRLAVGLKIRIPDGSTPPAGRAQPATSEAYVVQAGDSLWGIAQDQLGDGGRWREILRANPGLNADKLVVGQKLALPGGLAPERTTKVASAPKAGRRGGVR